MSVTKKTIMQAIESQAVVTKKEAEQVFNAIIDEITQALIDGKDVKCSQFGTFAVHTRGERLGRNPNTGEKMNIQSSANTYFHASTKISKQLNEDDDWFY